MKLIEPQHLCISIYPEDQWQQKDIEKVVLAIKDSYLKVNSHSECNICMTCEICRSLWDLHDPFNPGDYFFVCDYCKALLPIFEKTKGQQGLILFSHSLLKNEKIIEFSKELLENAKIKKIFLLELEYWKKEPKPEQLASIIDTRKLKLSEFISEINRDSFEFNILYEISKDNYY